MYVKIFFKQSTRKVLHLYICIYFGISLIVIETEQASRAMSLHTYVTPLIFACVYISVSPRGDFKERSMNINEI